MSHLSIPPASVDAAIAEAAADHTNPSIQNVARAVTWAADQHVIGAAATIAWLLSRTGDRGQRAIANHFALSIAAAVIAPKLLKPMVDRTRPDRVMGQQQNGVKKSGKAQDSFPSGHSINIGAAVSALSHAYPHRATVFMAAGAALAATRVMVLAHWTTDVLAGLTLGILIERGVRQVSALEPSKRVHVSQPMPLPVGDGHSGRVLQEFMDDSPWTYEAGRTLDHSTAVVLTNHPVADRNPGSKCMDSPDDILQTTSSRTSTQGRTPFASPPMNAVSC
jgi:PAP2 superfamily